MGFATGLFTPGSDIYNWHCQWLAGRTAASRSAPSLPQDVRNCWCGRGNNSPRVLGLFADETQNQALRDSLGCR
ncbi:MAG: hypothetical protein OXC82_12315 [Rhodobacteraceae bacterium]|nr:hypothetical protein [Paracoccaceae bacterium]MCY4309343.1 hypothetical protein [Paracoccaceae bacterium]